MEASRLGKMLSEQTTRTVIIGVLCMMILLPIIEEAPFPVGYAFALENLFWFGLSACATVEQFKESAVKKIPIECHPPEDGWITPEGYDFMIYEYTQSSRYHQGLRTQVVQRPILGLKVPDIKTPYEVDGRQIYGGTRWVEEVRSLRCPFVDEIEEYPFDHKGFMTKTTCPPGSCCWKRHPTCWFGGRARNDIFMDDDDADLCPWRKAEINMFTFTPDDCAYGRACEDFKVIVYYLDRYKVEMVAGYQLLQTTFIVILLGAGAMVFSKDTQSLVIAPIEKMVSIVKQLADDPLTKPDVADEDEEIAKKLQKKQGGGGGQLETSMLENTILKIGGLLQVGFGEAGAQIIGKNMSSQDGELNILIPGRKIIGVFGFCIIREFTDTTECLLEEVMVFVNKIARIVHLCVHSWSGAANKNIGDSFLVTWIPNDAEEQFKMFTHGYENSEKLSELADKSLIAFLKIMAEIRRASDLSAYARHPKIIPKFGMNYRVNMGFGLHVGWAIEGAIGSEYKIDASYLSPHVNMCARLESASHMYGVELLFSQALHAIISAKAKERVRKLDVVMVKGSQVPIGIYSFDVNDQISLAPEGHELGKIVPPPEISSDSLKANGVDWTFVLDQDIIRMQEGITLEFQNTWRQAFHFYINGKWQSAKELFMKCNTQLKYADGPSELLLQFIQKFDYIPPDDWSGFRALDSK